MVNTKTNEHYFTADATVENLPVLILQNSKAGIDQHFYTTSTYDAETAKKQFDWKKTGSFDQKEGVAWYALGQATSNRSTTSINQETAPNFSIPDVPYGWSITYPIDTTNYSSATYDYR